MGIQKIGHWKSRFGGYHCNIPYSSNAEQMEMEDNLALGVDLGDDTDGSELTEVNCELGLVDGQVCNIPYELYDLPDLREILSLDTWNSCLTDEERFNLSAYLPDMDQQTFWLTMKELLGGNDLFFGNPLDIFFKRLKGGFYPPKVSCFREVLQFVQRRKYYHSLKSYHENMTKMFMDIRKVWDQCKLTSGVQERIHVWRTGRKCTGVKLLDLNSTPKDESIVSEEVSSDAIMCHLSKKTKRVENKRSNNISPSLSSNGRIFVTPNCRAKGLLKVKAPGIGSFQGHDQKVVLSDILEQCRSVPKGVLKIVPKVPPVQSERPEVVARRLQPGLLGSTQGSQDCKFSSLPASVHYEDAGRDGKSRFRKVVSNEVHTSLDQPRCVLNRQETTIGIGPHLERSTRKVKREMNPSLDGNSVLRELKLFGNEVGQGSNGEFDSPMDTTGSERYTFDGASVRRNAGGGNKNLSLSLEPYPLDTPCHGQESHMEPVQGEHMAIYPRPPEVVSRISDVANGKREASMASSLDLKSQTDVSIRKSEKLVSKSSISEGFKDNTVLPLTYKRRKALAKINSLDLAKPLAAGADLKPVNPIEMIESNQHWVEGVKTLKIKFTGWNDFPLNKEP